MSSLRSRSGRIAAVVIALSAVMGLAACAATPVVAPIIVNTGDIQDATVSVPLNSMLVLKTGDLAVDSYTATIADPSIAEFVQGRVDGSATFNPGLKPLKVGTTSVTLTNKNGGIQQVVFELKVTPTPGGANLGGAGR
ncbi:MAG: hypothetical protein ABI632_07690 [Pseudolysinimonas sp.]